MHAGKKVWVLSAYHTGSHKAWAEGYGQHSRHDIRILSMAGRFWKWRMQGGPLDLAAQARRALANHGPPEMILATDMVNLPVFLGLLRRDLPAHVPTICYMHENQLTYPPRPGEKLDLTYGMINWLSQVAADGVVFNSRYHMQAWFDELPRLLKHFPDYRHLPLVQDVYKRSRVLPVGIMAQAFTPTVPIPTAPTSTAPTSTAPTMADPPLILWNQRWEYDKRPDRFFHLLYRLAEEGVAFRLAVAGENFRNVPTEFESARQRLADHIHHWGYLPDRAAYVDLVQQADLVISTADHEFFGISILEAICAGAFPLLPDRLSYPELVPESLHSACLYQDDAGLLELARLRLDQPRSAPPSLWAHGGSLRLARRPMAYDDLIDDGLGGQRRTVAPPIDHAATTRTADAASPLSVSMMENSTRSSGWRGEASASWEPWTKRSGWLWRTIKPKRLRRLYHFTRPRSRPEAGRMAWQPGQWVGGETLPVSESAGAWACSSMDHRNEMPQFSQ